MTISTQPLTEADGTALEVRGINLEQAEMLGWKSCIGRNGWVAFPFFRRGKVVNHKFRRIVKAEDGHNFEQDKGGEQCFYNLEALEALEKLSMEELRTTQVVITEGEFDCAIALQCGYLAVSVPSGAPAKPVDGEESKKFEFLKDFPRHAVAVLAVDDDAAGHVLRTELATRLGWHRCKWVQYPKQCKDLADVFLKYRQAGIDKVLKEKSQFMTRGGVFRMSEIPAQPEHRAYEIGIDNVSDMIKLRPGDLSVFTGIPSHGKTTFVNAIACNMARMYGWDVCFGSFEQNPRGDHLRFLRTYHAGRPAKDLIDTEIAEADKWIDRHFTFIVPDINTDDLATITWLIERIREVVTQKGANLIIIDPWNEIDHDRAQGMSLTEYTGHAIKKLKRLAKEYMIHILIVAHPAKMERNKDGGYAVPTLYDISDSAHWANKSDLGVVVSRIDMDDGSTVTEIRVLKVRYWGVIGRIGDKNIQYIPERATYIAASPTITNKEKPKFMKAKSSNQNRLDID